MSSKYKFIKENHGKFNINYIFWKIIKSKDKYSYGEALNLTEHEDFDFNKRMCKQRFFMEELILCSEKDFFNNFMNKHEAKIKYHLTRRNKSIIELCASCFIYSGFSELRTEDLENISENIYRFIKSQNRISTNKKLIRLNSMEKIFEALNIIQQEYRPNESCELNERLRSLYEFEILLKKIECGLKAKKVNRI